MIVILENIIHITMLQISSMIGMIIYALHTPMGAVIAISSLAYLGYVAIKSIAKDIYSVVNYVKYDKFTADSSGAIIPRAHLKKKRIYIKNIPSVIDIPIIITKTLVDSLINTGHIATRINVSNKRVFAFVNSHHYRDKITDT